MSHNLISFIFLIIATSTSLFSQIEISLHDTVIYTGLDNRISYPIRGSLSSTPLDSIRIIAVFDSKLLELSNVKGNNSYIMRSEFPQKSFDYLNIDSVRISISDSNLQPLNQSVICELEIEGLVNKDSVAYLAIDKIFINGIEQPVNSIRPAQIIVRGPRILPVNSEGLGENYPNPFEIDTRIPFQLKSTSKVRFYLYSASGELIQDSWDSQHSATFEYYQTDGTQLIITPESFLNEGGYYLKIIPIAWKFASGPYFIAMITDRGTYTKSIMHLK